MENNDNCSDFKDNEIKQNLIPQNSSSNNHIDIFEKMSPIEQMAFFRNTAIIRFGSIEKFSQELSVTRSMGSQLLSGKYIPLKPKTIQNIANILQVNVVLLTQTYEQLKEGNKSA